MLAHHIRTIPTNYSLVGQPFCLPLPLMAVVFPVYSVVFPIYPVDYPVVPFFLPMGYELVLLGGWHLIIPIDTVVMRS